MLVSLNASLEMVFPDYTSGHAPACFKSLITFLFHRIKLQELDMMCNTQCGVLQLTFVSLVVTFSLIPNFSTLLQPFCRLGMSHGYTAHHLFPGLGFCHSTPASSHSLFTMAPFTETFSHFSSSLPLLFPPMLTLGAIYPKDRQC